MGDRKPPRAGEERFVQANDGSVAYAKTGEIIENGFVGVLQPKRRNAFHGGWFAMAQEALSVLKSFRRLEDFRVLMSMLERLDYENLIAVSQKEIAAELEIDRSQVNRAIKRLIQAGALLEGQRIGQSRTYRLSPHFGWKGSAVQHRKAVEQQERERRETAERRSKLKVIDGGPTTGPAETDELFDKVEGQGELEFN